MFFSETYEVARQKLRKAEEEIELSEATDYETSKKKRKITHKKSFISSDDDSDATSDHHEVTGHLKPFPAAPQPMTHQHFLQTNSERESNQMVQKKSRAQQQGSSSAKTAVAFTESQNDAYLLSDQGR